MNTIGLTGYFRPKTQTEPKKALMAKIREKLLGKGYSIAAWSRLNGHNALTVVTNIHRYAVQRKMPHSPKVYAILNDLLRDTGINLMKKAE